MVEINDLFRHGDALMKYRDEDNYNEQNKKYSVQYTYPDGEIRIKGYDTKKEMDAAFKQCKVSIREMNKTLK